MSQDDNTPSQESLLPVNQNTPISKKGTWHGDLFQRRALSKRLTRLLERCPEGYVIAVDGPWGIGKSFMMERWARDLGDRCLFINAWKMDHQGSAFLALAAEVHEYLIARQGSSPGLKEAGRTFCDYVLRLAQFGKPMAAAACSTIGLFDPELAESLDAVKEFLNAGGELATFFSDSSRGSKGEKQTVLHTMKELEKAMEKCVQALPGTDDSPRMFVFVDELDRCRPTFAIELLESVKHLFTVKGIVFVFAANVNELAASVKAVYGSEFKSEEYLQRFFEDIIRLPRPDSRTHAKALFQKHPVSADYFHPSNSRQDIAEHELFTFLVAMSDDFGLSIRQQQQVYRRFRTAAHLIAGEREPVLADYLLVSVAAQTAYPDTYRRWRDGELGRRAFLNTVWNRGKENPQPVDGVKPHSSIQECRQRYGVDTESHAKGKLDALIASSQKSSEWELDFLQRLVRDWKWIKLHDEAANLSWPEELEE